jgi:hypothetical protein
MSNKRTVRISSARQAPANTNITFWQSGNRPAARYVSANSVYEEALEHGRLVGLYWSASGRQGIKNDPRPNQGKE